MHGRARRSRERAAARGVDAGGVCNAAKQPRDGLDVHSRRRRCRARPRRRPDDGASRQDARRLLGDQLHGVCPRASGRLRRVGGRAAPRVGATTTSWPTSRRARALLRVATSSWTPKLTTPRVRSESPCARLCSLVRESSSTPRSQRGSPSVTTTAATAVDPPVSCRSCRPRLAKASVRARTTRSSKATPSSDRISR